VNLAFVFLGCIAAIAGLALLVAGIRGRPGENPKATAKLIGGMMLAAFGILIAGFAIGYARAAPMEVAR
jgi:hypothetical protein